MPVEYKYCNYLITCKLNNRKYIGKTKINPSKRWASYRRNVENNQCTQIIEKAIKKHGIENFTFEIIKKYRTEKEALIGEKKLIKKYKTLISENGYNVDEGGASNSTNKNFSNSIAKKIISDYIKDEKISSIQLAKKYKTNKTNILEILQRKTYTDLKLDDQTKLDLWLKLKSNNKGVRNINYSAKYIKLKSADIPKIFNLYINHNCSLGHLAKKYNVRIGNIKFILQRVSWKHVVIDKELEDKAQVKLLKNTENFYQNYGKIIKRANKRNKLNIDNVKIIFDLYANQNATIQDICNKFNLDRIKVLQILIGKRFENLPIDNKIKELAQIKIINDLPKNHKFVINNIFNDFLIKRNSIQELSLKYKESKSKIVEILKGIAYKSKASQENIDLANYYLKTNRSPGHQVADSEYIKAFNMYLDGYTINQISKYIKHSVNDFFKFPEHLNRRNISKELINKVKEKRKLSNKKKRIDQDTYTKIINDYCKGLTFQELSDKYNFKPCTLYSLVKRQSHLKFTISKELEEKVKASLQLRGKNVKKRRNNRRIRRSTK